MLTGSCLCGGVVFEAGDRIGDPIACHCTQCRRQSGHHFAAVPASGHALRFLRDDGLTWYRHTATAMRGLCVRCGSSLCWRGAGSEAVMVAMAALDETENLHLSGHYWVDYKGDYYEIADDLPQYRGDDP